VVCGGTVLLTVSLLCVLCGGTVLLSVCVVWRYNAADSVCCVAVQCC
jgi:hypothetical protein